jgi:hypothetical protein
MSSKRIIYEDVEVLGSLKVTGAFNSSAQARTVTKLASTEKKLNTVSGEAEAAATAASAAQAAAAAAQETADTALASASKYLGIGELSALTTAAFVRATVDVNGSITVGAAVSPNLGDWMINYSSTGASVGIYYWNGSAWIITTEVRYIDSCSTDLLNLGTGGITVGGVSTFLTAIMKRLFAQYIKIGASIRGGDRYAEDGSIADGTKPGFYIAASGACRVAGIEFDGSEGGGVQWSGASQIGTELNLGIVNGAVMARLSSSRILIHTSANGGQSAYDWNNRVWASAAIQFVNSNKAQQSVAALSTTLIAVYDALDATLSTYQLSGSAWVLVGSALSLVSSGSYICALSATDIALFHNTSKELRRYHWDGTNWAMVGNALALSTVSAPSLTALSGTDIAMIDNSSKVLRRLHWNGSAFELLGTLTIATATYPTISALNGSDVAYVDANDQLCIYRYSTASWEKVLSASSADLGTSSVPVVVALSGTDIAIIGLPASGGSYWYLRTYRFAFALSKPWQYPFTP